mgnify:CR=1 FL=1
MEICKLEHIHKDYRMGEIVTPLKDISLTVNEGDFIAVEGPSGIGKSTLLLQVWQVFFTATATTWFRVPSSAITTPSRYLLWLFSAVWATSTAQ